MAKLMQNPEPGSSTQSVFGTTLWTVVLKAGDVESDEGRRALEQLCQAYWPPVYAFLRRQGRSPADAQDLTQGFFASLLRHGSLVGVSPEKGRFRSFLLASLRKFLSDDYDRSTALKRGGGQPIVSLDEESAEAFYARQVSDGVSPDTAFERHWAQSLLLRAQQRLLNECRAASKEILYNELGPHRYGDHDKSYAEIASGCGLSEGAARATAHRMRLRYQELIRDEIAQTVHLASDIDAEVQYLVSVLSDRTA
jgi:RNA polymerase sigma factor (sigma-70 family)